MCPRNYWTQTFLNNQLWHVGFSGNNNLSIDVQPLDNHTPLTFDSLGNVTNGQVSYGEDQWLRFVDSAVVEAHMPATSYGKLNDPFGISELPDSMVLLPSSGITAGDLKGLNFTVTQDPVSGITRTELDVGADAGQGVLGRLFDKLESGVESLEDSLERLKNRLLLFGPYTDAELAMEKELEIQKVLSDPSKIYVISCKSNSAVSYAIRGTTYQLGDNDSVNHTALAFQKLGGEMYVLDIEMGRGLKVTKFNDWAKEYVDIQAQDLSLNQDQIINIRNNVIYGEYVDQITMKPKININYDSLGAIFGGGLHLPISESPDKRFCSSLLYDILVAKAGIELSGLDEMSNPNEFRHAIDEYLRKRSP